MSFNGQLNVEVEVTSRLTRFLDLCQSLGYFDTMDPVWVLSIRSLARHERITSCMFGNFNSEEEEDDDDDDKVEEEEEDEDEKEEEEGVLVAG